MQTQTHYAKLPSRYWIFWRLKDGAATANLWFLELPMGYIFNSTKRVKKVQVAHHL